MEKIDISIILRWLLSALGGVVAVLEPALPYIGICTLAILYDCYTAWSLGRRVRKSYPEKTNGGAYKFNSHHFAKVIVTLIKSWALILLAYLVEVHITSGIPVDMTKVAAGAICFWQLWSIFENESSCNGARWAKVMQKIMIDKTERHFDIDLSDLKNGKEE